MTAIHENHDAVHRKVVTLLSQQKPHEAKELLERHLKKDPTHPGLRHDLAVTLAQTGQLNEAYGIVKLVAQHHPTFIDATANTGKLAYRLGQLNDAERFLRSWCGMQPDQSEAHMYLGLALKSARKYPDAIAAFEQAGRLDPRNPDIPLKLGITALLMKKPLEAERAFRAALTIKPNYPEVLNNLGTLYQELGRYEEALNVITSALSLKPDSPSVLINLATAQLALKQSDKAQMTLKRMLALVPNSPDAHNLIGTMELGKGRLQKAYEHFQTAINHKPDFAEAYNNLGLFFAQRGDCRQALSFINQALLYKPDLAGAHVNKALQHLILGDFEQGFAEYEWRWKTKQQPLPILDRPQWDGGSLSGQAILVFTEQGLGDTFQFLRFLPTLKAKGATVNLVAPVQLHRILARCSGIDHVVAPSPQLPEFSVYCPLMSLPRFLKTTVSSIPDNVPYIAPDRQLVSHWESKLADITAFKIAVAWQGNPEYQGDALRSIPLSAFRPLAEIPGVKLISVQKGPGVDQIPDAGVDIMAFSKIDEEAGAFEDTSAILQNMDLVICSDSCVAHLAGAMGIPVWLILPYGADWRWLKNRDDSPWYPSMRLFRQDERGRWDEPFADAAAALKSLLDCKRSLPADPTPEFVKGKQFFGKGLMAEALGCFLLAIQQDGSSYGVWNYLGLAQLHKGLLDDAMQSFRRALEIHPSSHEVFNNLGLAHCQKGQHQEGMHCFKKAIAFHRHSSEYFSNLAAACLQLRDADAAIRHYEQALAIRPDWAEIQRSLGGAYRMKGDTAKARSAFDSALGLRPNFCEVHNDLGALHVIEDRFDEAIVSFRQAIAANDKFYDAWNNLGVVLADTNRLDESIATFEKAMERFPGQPELRRNYALLLLLSGQYEKGFREYEWRWQCPKSGRRQFSKPQWDGGDLEGKRILLYSEQGLGDTLQFIRYARLVQKRGGHVILECPKHLVRLLKPTPGFHEIVARGEPLPEFDVHAPLMSLPHLLRQPANHFSELVPYLYSPPEKRDEWAKFIHRIAGLKVGISWQGNPKYGGDKYRSIPIQHFLRLGDVPNVTYFSLQKHFGVEQLPQLPSSIPVIDLDRRMDAGPDGFLDTAGVLANLDLFITSDSAVVHLAGGMGRPVWLLLGANCDWRWGRNGEQCPWYPTVRVFRQRTIKNWDDVFEAVHRELAILAGKR